MVRDCREKMGTGAERLCCCSNLPPHNLLCRTQFGGGSTLDPPQSCRVLQGATATHFQHFQHEAGFLPPTVFS
jgi:hypothetical protein